MPPSDVVVKLEVKFGTALSKKDRTRLEPHLVGYNRLNELLLLNGIPIEDIQKLIMLEVEGKRRPFILKKLVGRLKSKERQQLHNLIASCLKNTSNDKCVVTLSQKDASHTSSPRRCRKASRTAS